MRRLFDAIAILLHSLQVTKYIQISRNDRDRDPLLDGQTGRERGSQQRQGERKGERAVQLMASGQKDEKDNEGREAEAGIWVGVESEAAVP